MMFGFIIGFLFGEFIGGMIVLLFYASHIEGGDE